MDRAQRHALWLAIARAAFGLPAVAAPDSCLRSLGRSRRSDADPGRLFVGFFGVRELLLGAFIAALRERPEQLRAVVALGALADVGDTAYLALSLARRGLKQRQALLLGSGIAGSVASIAVWRELASSKP